MMIDELCIRYLKRRGILKMTVLEVSGGVVSLLDEGNPLGTTWLDFDEDDVGACPNCGEDLEDGYCGVCGVNWNDEHSVAELLEIARGKNTQGGVTCK
jgi:hypothetical protein